jgi:RNA polymerase sigma factor (sigma-70 family)
VEAIALKQPTAQALASPLLRFQSDERLIAHIRRGHPRAFETLVRRYQPRLLGFCAQMVSSSEDAEDIVQDVFASAFSAICADSRPINVRPWLYRIARNRCLNHLRRPAPTGQDSMDVFERDGGTTTVDRVHTREEFRQLVADVRTLPASQRRALLLREVNTLSYEEIADEMDTSVSSVKSLLARARTSLGEAAEGRLVGCDDARSEIDCSTKTSNLTGATRRHLKRCESCEHYRRRLRKPNLKAAGLLPFAPLDAAKKLLPAKVGGGAGGGAFYIGGATTGPVGMAASSAVPVGASAVASKAAGLFAAALVTAGAVEVKHSVITPQGQGAHNSDSQPGTAPAQPANPPQKQDAQTATAPLAFAPLKPPLPLQAERKSESSSDSTQRQPSGNSNARDTHSGQTGNSSHSVSAGTDHSNGQPQAFARVNGTLHSLPVESSQRQGSQNQSAPQSGQQSSSQNKQSSGAQIQLPQVPGVSGPQQGSQQSSVGGTVTHVLGMQSSGSSQSTTQDPSTQSSRAGTQTSGPSGTHSQGSQLQTGQTSGSAPSGSGSQSTQSSTPASPKTQSGATTGSDNPASALP